MEKREIRQHIDSNPRTSSLKVGQYKIICPNCSSQRKNKKDKRGKGKGGGKVEGGRGAEMGD